MEFILSLITGLSGKLRPHSTQVSLVMVATLLAIYADDINRIVKRPTRKLPFVFRIAAFMAVSSFGYAAVLIWLSRLMADFLARLNNYQLCFVVIAFFMGIGVLAERKRFV